MVTENKAEQGARSNGGHRLPSLYRTTGLRGTWLAVSIDVNAYRVAKDEPSFFSKKPTNRPSKKTSCWLTRAGLDTLERRCHSAPQNVFELQTVYDFSLGKLVKLVNDVDDLKVNRRYEAA